MASMEDGIKRIEEGRYEEALNTFLALDTDPQEHPELSYYLGLCYTNLERYDEAVLYLEQLVSGNAEFLHIYQGRMLLGYIYTRTDRPQMAELEFSKLIEDGFKSAKVHAALAHVQYVLGKTNASILQLERALEVDPDNPTALNSLGYIMADNGIRLNASLSYCKKAVAAKPDNPAYLDSLGWANFKLGNVGEARRLIRAAYDKAPDNQEIAEHWQAVRRVS